MTTRCSGSAPRGQRGAAALAVTMVLLFCMTLVAFFVNRGLLFEQRTSANQYRATRAFEVAEAGVEWATAMLNDLRLIDDQCVASGAGAASFRGRYAPHDVAYNITPPANARASCRIELGVLTCHCPAAGTAPSAYSAPEHPQFTVEIADEPGDPEAVRVASWACLNRASACVPGATGAGDATAVVRATLKLRATLRAAPAAPLTAGRDAAIGNMSIINEDAASNGFLINAGGAISGTLTPPQLQSLPGTPIQAALIEDDASLLALADADVSGDAVFQAFFGARLSRFQSAPTTYVVTGGGAAANGSSVVAAYALGQRSFYVDGDVALSTGVLGTAAEPVTIVATGNVTLGNTLNGLVFSAQGTWSTGTSPIINGAVVAADNYTNTGIGTLTYDPVVLRNVRLDTGVLVRVPGSWRDF